jgi:hypothetical protein
MRDSEDIDVAPSAGERSMDRFIELLPVEMITPQLLALVFCRKTGILVAPKTGFFIGAAGRT